LPTVPRPEDHKISSSNTQTLTGTVYLPTGKLRVDPGARVAENSAYTAIIAREIEIDQGPELVLNSDYGATGRAGSRRHPHRGPDRAVRLRAGGCHRNHLDASQQNAPVFRGVVEFDGGLYQGRQ
jgi:hypothetical protein